MKALATRWPEVIPTLDATLLVVQGTSGSCTEETEETEELEETDVVGEGV